MIHSVLLVTFLNLLKLVKGPITLESKVGEVDMIRLTPVNESHIAITLMCGGVWDTVSMVFSTEEWNHLYRLLDVAVVMPIFISFESNYKVQLKMEVTKQHVDLTVVPYTGI